MYYICYSPLFSWLRDDYKDFSNRDKLKDLPIYEFIPDNGRITRSQYIHAIEQYCKKYDGNIKLEKTEKPLSKDQKKVLEDYLPKLRFIEANCDVSEETKSEGKTLFSEILGTINERIPKKDGLFEIIINEYNRIKDLIENGQEVDKENNRQKLLLISKLEHDLSEYLSEWDVKPKINIDIPEIAELMRENSKIKLDDGIETNAEEKGNGLQRSLIFALMQYLAKEARITEENAKQDLVPNIFLFEEPEIYLHPHMCKATYQILKDVAKTDQVLICTHSANFIEMEDYKCISIVKKPSLETGTIIHQVKENIIESSKKQEFNMINLFNPDRNEVFFAKKVILVEGSTEKIILPLIAEKIGCYDSSISIVDCGGKGNLPIYIKVLNAFNIKYIAVHDDLESLDKEEARFNKFKSDTEKLLRELSINCEDCDNRDSANTEFLK